MSSEDVVKELTFARLFIGTCEIRPRVVAPVKVACHCEGDGQGSGEAFKERLTWIPGVVVTSISGLLSIVVAEPDSVSGADLNGEDVSAM